MQRLSSLVTLTLFMFMLSWAVQAFQQDPLPFRTGYKNGLINPQPPDSGQELSPERVALPDQNGANLDDAKTPQSRTEIQKSLPGKPRPNNPYPATEAKIRPPHPSEDCIPFLLLGRSWDYNTIGFVMMVTLTRGSHSQLTAIDPAFPVELEGALSPLSELLQRGGGYDELCRASSEITGFTPQFYIDLNTNGFLEMIDMLGGINREVYRTLAGASAGFRADELDGEDILRKLADPQMSTEDKELLLMALLITARDIQHTTLGLSLLWTGYRNMKTNLGLSDLLEVRRVTQEIQPTRVRFREIGPPGP